MVVKQASKENAFVNPYLPRTLIEWYSGAAPGMVHHTSHHEGIVACLDASGFTELTRQLSIDKKYGPENLTDILNGFFRSITDLIFHYRGDVLKYAGDAIWIYFPRTIDISDFFHHALDTVENLNRVSAELQHSPIRIHIGAESGSFDLVSMGKEHFRLEVEPLGSMIHDVMRACDLAKTDQMVVGEQLASQIPQYESLYKPETGFYLLKAVGEVSKTIFNDAPASPEEEIPHDIRLEQYLPRNLIERAKLTSTVAIAQSELRDVTVLFANFRTTVDQESDQSDYDVTSINDKLTSAFEIISHSGGSITRIDPYYDGHKLLVLYGAPNKHEDDELTALHCATKLLKLVDADFDLRIGLANGSLFCGDVGTDRRREYTVMGEAVNMAARLMANTSWGKILIDDHLRKKLPENIRTVDERLTLKGVGENVLCHQFREISEPGGSRSERNAIIGRESEYQQCKSFIGAASSSEIGIMTITGEAGVGKSTLVENAINGIDDIRSIKIAGRHSFLYGQAWVARKLLNGLFSIFRDGHYKSLGDFAVENVESTWLPLVGDITDVSVEDNIWTKGLSQEQKRQKAAELYRLLIAAIVTEPIVIIIDDFDQSDEYSKSLLLHLLSQPEQLPGTFILIQRDDTPLGELLNTKITHLKLDPPTDSEWRSYFKIQFADGKRELELTEGLIDISKGNPQFISEFINHLCQQEKLKLNNITCKYELTGSLGGAEIPTSINDIYLSRFDLLPETDKRLLKSAAVFETRFQVDALSAVIGEDDKNSLNMQLGKLVEDGVLQYDPEYRSFGFADNAFQFIIGSCLPESFLLASHGEVAKYFESSGETIPASILANHYFKSKQWQKAFNFSLAAADEALRLFALSDSLRLFRQCEVSLEQSENSDISSAEIYKFYASYNSYLVLEGDLDKAYRLLRAWKEFAENEGNTTQKISAILEKAQLDWQQSKYNECREALERVLENTDIQQQISLIARTYAILAEVERRSGNFSLAQDCCRQSIDSYRDLGDYQGLSDAYNKLGLALWGEGKLDEAAESYELSLQYGKDVNGMIVQSQIENNLAIIKWEQGDLLKSEQLMRHALGITKQIGNRRDEAYVSGNLSSIQNILGRFSSSRKLLLQADMIFTRLNDTHAHNYVIGNLGDIDLVEGKIEDAEAKFDKVIQFAEEVEDKELFAECQIRIGEVLFYTGNIEQARIKYNEGISLANQIDSSEYFMRSAIGLCRLHIGERNIEEAERLIDETMEKAIDCNSILVKNEIGFLTGELNRLINNLAGANHCYHETLEYALQQNVFELILKSSVRLYENDNSSKTRATEIISGIRHQFNLDNGPDSWEELMNSCYYRFFANTISEMA